MAPFVGGAEVAAERLAVGLREAGHEVVVILGTRGAVEERMEAAGLRRLHSPMHLTDRWHYVRYLSSRNRLRRLLDRERPDVIHSNDLPTHQIVSDAARGLRIPRVCHHRFGFGPGAADWLNKFGAERHLFVSEALMREVCADSAAIRSSPRAVVHDGLPLPPRPSEADRLRLRRGLGLEPGRTIVCFAGQIIERKGVADLIRAWSALEPTARDGAELLIIGDDLQNAGRYLVEMKTLASELGVGANFLGFRSDVGLWLAASDLAVVPSHVEPLGNATLEAMSLGLPVVACAVGGIPEMVVHEETGLLVPPHAPGRLADALGRLLGDGPTRRRFGESGRSRCEERFSIRSHVNSVLDEYRRLEAAGAPSRPGGRT